MSDVKEMGVRWVGMGENFKERIFCLAFFIFVFIMINPDCFYISTSRIRLCTLTTPCPSVIYRFTCGYVFPKAVRTWLRASLPRSPDLFATANFNRSTRTLASSAVSFCVNSSRSGACDTISGSPVLVTCRNGSMPDSYGLNLYQIW